MGDEGRGKRGGRTRVLSSQSSVAVLTVPARRAGSRGAGRREQGRVCWQNVGRKVGLCGRLQDPCTGSSGPHTLHTSSHGRPRNTPPMHTALIGTPENTAVCFA